MEKVVAFTNLDSNEAFQACPVLGLDSHAMQVKLSKRVGIGSPVKVEADDTLSLGEVSYCRHEDNGYIVEVELLESLHNVTELSRLARALVPENYCAK